MKHNIIKIYQIKEKHLKKSITYGPVPSRRYGLSLGVDLVPYKTCSFDCIYCQLGKTTNLTINRQDFINVSDILKQIENALLSDLKPDVITFAGSGEPTLHKSFNQIVKGIKNITDTPILLLTNGSLLFIEEVAEAVMNVDILAPSIDAGDKNTFNSICKPCNSLDFNIVVNGIENVSQNFKGKLNLEVMLIKNSNDNKEQIDLIQNLIKKIKVNSIDINTPVRPSPGRNVLPCSLNKLNYAKSVFGNLSEIIVKKESLETISEKTIQRDVKSLIINTISRRPCTIKDICKSLNLSNKTVSSTLNQLVKDNMVLKELLDETYYRIIS